MFYDFSFFAFLICSVNARVLNFSIINKTVILRLHLMYTKIDNSIQSFKNNHYATQTDSELRCVVIIINETTEFAVRSMYCTGNKWTYIQMK